MSLVPTAKRAHHRGPQWWCMLPDIPAASNVTTVLSGESRVAVRHPSGRAWLVTHPATPAPQLMTTGEAVSMITFGASRLRGHVAPAARRALEHGEFEPLMMAVGGGPVLLAHDRRLHAVADAAGFCRMFTTRYGPVPLVASHADVLRRLVDASLDRAWIAAKLASPEMPHALRQTRSPFCGVEPISAGHFATVYDGDRMRTHRWWQAPAGDRGLDDGASELGAALAEAVECRVESADAVSVQLSGGLDSTVLSHLAGPSQPLLITTAGSSPVDDDLLWARRVAAALDTEHHVIDSDQAPAFFSELDHPLAVGMDEPCSFTAGAARQRYVASLLAERGIGVHLNGQGGDEVVEAPVASLSPRPGARRWRRLRGHAARHGVSAASLLAALIRRPDHATWLRRAAKTLRHTPIVAAELVGWEAAPLLPPWASAEANQLVAELITDTDPAPVHPDAGTHATVARIRASAYRAGLYRDVMTTAGVPTAMPYFDHAVLTACLSVRPEHRLNPWRPKPLLQQAMRDTVPAHLLRRRTKSDYNHDIYRGWKQHRHQVRDLLADSRLAQLDLIDMTALRRELDTFGPSELPPAFVTDLVALEVWLRDLTAASPTVGQPCAA